MRRLFVLTSTEAEVAYALCGGATKNAVAAERGLRESTIRTHVASILSKNWSRQLARPSPARQSLLAFQRSGLSMEPLQRSADSAFEPLGGPRTWTPGVSHKALHPECENLG